MEIFKLFGSIFVDSAEADKSIAKTESKAEGLGAKLGNGIKTAGKWGLALGAAAAGAGAAMMGAATKAAETTDRIDKLSQKIGLSREAFQEWDFIASQSGMDVEKLQGGLKTLNQRMDETMKGTGKGAEHFNKLGISVTDSTGALKSQEQVFEETVARLQELPDGAEKARLATELFGKSGQELMPLLNGAAGSVEEMKEKAHELGLVLGDDAIDAGVAFTDIMDQTKRAMSAVFTQIGVRVMPILQTFFEWVLSHMPQIQSIISTVFSVLSVVVDAAVVVFRDYLLPIFSEVWAFIQNHLAPIFQSWFGDMQGNLPIIQEIFDQVFSFIKDIAEQVWLFFKDNILPIFVGLYEWIQGHMPTIRATVEKVFNKIIEVAKLVWSFFKDNILPILERLYDYIQSKMPQIQSIIEKVFNVIADVVKIAWDIFENLLLPALKALWDYVAAPAFKLIQTIVEDVFDAIFWAVDAVVGVFEKVTGAIQTAMDWLSSWDNKKVSKKTIEVEENRTSSSTPRNATGTNYFQGGRTLVGEMGPELVTLPRGSKIKPANQTRNMLETAGAQTINIQPAPIVIDKQILGQVIFEVIDEISNRNSRRSRRFGGEPLV